MLFACGHAQAAELAILDVGGTLSEALYPDTLGVPNVPGNHIGFQTTLNTLLTSDDVESSGPYIYTRYTTYNTPGKITVDNGIQSTVLSMPAANTFTSMLVTYGLTVEQVGFTTNDSIRLDVVTSMGFGLPTTSATMITYYPQGTYELGMSIEEVLHSAFITLPLREEVSCYRRDSSGTPTSAGLFDASPSLSLTFQPVPETSVVGLLAPIAVSFIGRRRR